jgi:hypothetical protein
LITLPFRIVEYSLTLGFPLLVLFIALTLYPMDYSEVFLFASEGLRDFNYVSTLVVASGYNGWQTGYGVVEDVEVREGEPVYMLKVRVGESVVRVVAFKLGAESGVSYVDLKNLKGVEITFYGPQVDVRGERVVLARVIVMGAPDMHGMHHAMCMYKGDFSKKCAEMMEKHMEMMKRRGSKG